jgi:lysophospholipase L1-like esterase
MRTMILAACVVFASNAMNTPCIAQDSELKKGKNYGTSERFEKDIQRFEAADKKNPPPEGAIVCIGSSSMRLWQATIKEDLAPLTIIPRGFGGSTMNDALNFADRIVLPYKPRAIVLYEGDNDISQGIAIETLTNTFRAFVTKVHAASPDCRIYFLSIKPSISRWNIWPEMKKANSLINAECAKDKRLTFVDVASSMLDAEGKPLKHLFKSDNLHMTKDGYVIWRDVLKPILLKNELQFEPQKPANLTKAKEQK